MSKTIMMRQMLETIEGTRAWRSIPYHQLASYYVAPMKENCYKSKIYDNCTTGGPRELFTEAVIAAGLTWTSSTNGSSSNTLNLTNMVRPLDVYGPFKKQWSKILDKWKEELRTGGILVKPQLLKLLKRLINSIYAVLQSYEHVNFRSCSCPEKASIRSLGGV